jgi:hypothetical protein
MDYQTLWYQLKRVLLKRPLGTVNQDAVLDIMAHMECDLYLNQEVKPETPPPEPEPPMIHTICDPPIPFKEHKEDEPKGLIKFFKRK